MKKILLLSLLLIVLTSCVSVLDMEYISEITDNTELEDLQFEVVVEPFQLRQDLVRNTKTTIWEKADGADRVRTSDIPLHSAGVNIGNNIILDLNGNIAVDIIGFFNLGEDFEFEMTYTSPIIVARLKGQRTPENGTVSRNVQTDFFFQDNTTFEKNETVFADSFKYEQTENTVIVNGKKRITIESPVEVAFLMGNRKVRIKFSNENTIKIKGYLKIVKTDSGIEFYEFIPPLFGTEADGSYELLKTFVLTRKGFAIYDTGKGGYNVEREGDVIHIYQGKTLHQVINLKGVENS